MVSITNDYGIFTGETEADALKAARKGKREAAKRAERRNALAAQAALIATEKGFRMLARVAKGEPFPSGWRFYAAGARWADNLFQSGKDWDTHGHHIATEFVTENDTRVTVTHYGMEMVGAVCGGAGFTMCYFLRDGTTGAVECWALASVEGVWYAVPVPSISPEQFATDASEEAKEVPTATV